MNPVIAAAGAEAVSKININKVLAIVGVALLVVIMVLVIRKSIKKNKKEADDEAYLDKISTSVNQNNLSYDPMWYESKAVGLAADLDASFGNNGGWLGCNQQGVYDTMELLKTQDDLTMLEKCFGTRELNASWLKKKKPYVLVEAVKTFMTKGEIRKINKILADNGIVSPF